MNQTDIVVFHENLFLDLYDKSILDLIEEHLKKYKWIHTKRAYRDDICWFFDFINVSQPQQLKYIPFWEICDLCNDYIYDCRNTRQAETLKKKLKEKIIKEEPTKAKKEIVELVKELVKEERLNPEYKHINHRTLNRKAYALKRFFDFLIHKYNYPKNPLEEYIPESIELKTTTQAITERDLLNMIHYTREEYYKTKRPYFKLSKLQIHLIICFLALSLRRSEVANLQWGDMNTEEQYIKVLGKWEKMKYIPIPSPIFNLLTIFKELKEGNWYVSDFIFSPIKKWRHDKNKAINNNYLFWLIKKLCNKLDIQWTITPHSFRTWFVRKALDKWLWFIEIMNATGHSSMELIKYYDTRSQVDNNAINSILDTFE